MLFITGVLATVAITVAQPPPGKDPGKKQKKGDKGGGRASDNPDLVTYLMSFDKDKDGKLTKEELTDARLHRLFDRADTDKKGFVTRQQLEALAAKMAAEDGGPGGPGGPKGKFGPPKKE
jgi:hypothetical protein